MNASDVARTLLAQCAAERRRLAGCRMTPLERRWFADRDVTPPMDDPPMRVRASSIEAVCVALLEVES